MTRLRQGLAIAVVLLATLAPAASADVPLTLMTWNIHHAEGADGVLSLERVAQVIESSGADVVALQEVDKNFDARSGFADQPAELAARLGMHVAYGPNLQRGAGQFGNAILSRYPLAGAGNTALPRLNGTEQRGLLEADVPVGGTSVRIRSTHLQHDSPDPVTARVTRLLQSLAILGRTAGVRGPQTLMGDLNAVPLPLGLEILPLYLPFADAWPGHGAGPGNTIPATGPNRRIDYVLTSRDVAVTGARVIPTLASDHLPVVASVRLP